MKLTSGYIQAANVLRGKAKRKRVVAYVESYDDVLFWRNVLGDYENEERYFEVMLPTRNCLTKGKKQAIMQMLKDGGGECMIACVDADYDYLIQRSSSTSKAIIDNPFVFHTFAYSIENYQCYAPSLHNVCVMATLNDHSLFDFTAFLSVYSEVIFPLFVWNIWYYRRNNFHTFSMSDFNHVIELQQFNMGNPQRSIDSLQGRVRRKLADLRRNCADTPEQREAIVRKVEALADEIQTLGVTPSTTYMYIQGHLLFDNIVSPIVERVCKTLRNEREMEIRQKAAHDVQRQNELSAYRHAQMDIEQMLKKNTGYTHSAPYKRLRDSLDKVYPNG